MFKTKEEIVETIYAALPYAHQIRELDLSLPDQVRFNWRGTRFVVNINGSVEESENHCLIGSDLAIMLEQLIKKTYFSKFA